MVIPLIAHNYLKPNNGSHNKLAQKRTLTSKPAFDIGDVNYNNRTNKSGYGSQEAAKAPLLQQHKHLQVTLWEVTSSSTNLKLFGEPFGPNNMTYRISRLCSKQLLHGLTHHCRPSHHPQGPICGVLQGKTAGRDGWTPGKLTRAPIEAMDMAANLLKQVGDKPWPKPLLQWQQIHTPKPGKVNAIPNARPLALGSAWYRLWSSFYTKQLKDWTSKQLPSQQHGAISKRGVATALIPLLCGIEQGLHEPNNPALPHFIGTADLSKAFDRVYAPAADQALQRMQLPDFIRQPLAMQWNQQQRWLTVGQHVAAAPLTDIQCLPQGDSASPLALHALLTEPLRRILQQQNMQNTQNTTSLSLTTGVGSAAQQNNAWQPLIYGETKFKPSSSQKTAPNKTSLPLAARKMSKS